jgi:hypothetical protein
MRIHSVTPQAVSAAALTTTDMDEMSRSFGCCYSRSKRRGPSKGTKKRLRDSEEYGMYNYNYTPYFGINGVQGVDFAGMANPYNPYAQMCVGVSDFAGPRNVPSMATMQSMATNMTGQPGGASGADYFKQIWMRQQQMSQQNSVKSSAMQAALGVTNQLVQRQTLSNTPGHSAGSTPPLVSSDNTKTSLRGSVDSADCGTLVAGSTEPDSPAEAGEVLDASAGLAALANLGSAALCMPASSSSAVPGLVPVGASTGMQMALPSVEAQTAVPYAACAPSMDTQTANLSARYNAMEDPRIPVLPQATITSLQSLYNVHVNSLLKLPPTPSDLEFAFERGMFPISCMPFEERACLAASRFAELALGSMASLTCDKDSSKKLAKDLVFSATELFLKNCYNLCGTNPTLAKTYFLLSLYHQQSGDLVRAARYRRYALNTLGFCKPSEITKSIKAAIVLADTLLFRVAKGDTANVPLSMSASSVFAERSENARLTLTKQLQLVKTTNPGMEDGCDPSCMAHEHLMFTQGGADIMNDATASNYSRALDAYAYACRLMVGGTSKEAIEEVLIVAEGFVSLDESTSRLTNTPLKALIGALKCELGGVSYEFLIGIATQFVNNPKWLRLVGGAAHSMPKIGEALLRAADGEKSGAAKRSMQGVYDNLRTVVNQWIATTHGFLAIAPMPELFCGEVKAEVSPAVVEDSEVTKVTELPFDAAGSAMGGAPLSEPDSWLFAQFE